VIPRKIALLAIAGSIAQGTDTYCWLVGKSIKLSEAIAAIIAEKPRILKRVWEAILLSM
jgi:hypothetical protein